MKLLHEPVILYNEPCTHRCTCGGLEYVQAIIKHTHTNIFHGVKLVDLLIKH